MDYTGGVQTFTFPVGASSATVSIPIQDDQNNELTERFTAELFNPQGATIGPSSTATVDITDNDGKANDKMEENTIEYATTSPHSNPVHTSTSTIFTLSFLYNLVIVLVVVTVMFDPDTYTVKEGESIMATVVLSQPSVRPVSVDVTSSSGTATGTEILSCYACHC